MSNDFRKKTEYEKSDLELIDEIKDYGDQEFISRIDISDLNEIYTDLLEKYGYHIRLYLRTIEFKTDKVDNFWLYVGYDNDDFYCKKFNSRQNCSEHYYDCLK